MSLVPTLMRVSFGPGEGMGRVCAAKVGLNIRIYGYAKDSLGPKPSRAERLARLP